MELQIHKAAGYKKTGDDHVSSGSHPSLAKVCVPFSKQASMTSFQSLCATALFSAAFFQGM
jgi:hypothetical protein